MSLIARLIWPPYPYKAGFSITDDTDAATNASVKIVYDFLAAHQLPTTKTVWPFVAEEKSGIPPTPESTLRGVTLEDEQYLAYCKELQGKGFEIALHGASAGNNKRESTRRAFDLLEREFGLSPVFICHSKNADNIYWGEKTIPWAMLRWLARLAGKHSFSGEKKDSPYYWGDLCFQKIRYIRLFRTRDTNTLKANPSMPYYDPERPLVKGWFSATKRSFHDATTTEALERLKRENGATILYHYMHRYADETNGTVKPRFAESAQRLANDKAIWVKPAGTLLSRLETMQGTFCFYRENKFWLVNTREEPVDNVQITLDKPCKIEASLASETRDGVLSIPQLPGRAIASFQCDQAISFAGKRSHQLPAGLANRVSYDYGSLFVNFSDAVQTVAGVTVEAKAYLLQPGFQLDGFKPMSRIGRFEEIKIFAMQVAIILREVLFRGRNLNADKYLGSKTITLEDQDTW